MSTASDSNRPWFEASPERLQWELDRFAEHALPAAHRVVPLGDGSPASLWIETELSFKDEAVRISILLPADYPDAPPSFFGPRDLLERHEYPGQHELCWSADQDRDWHPGRDAAYIVANNLWALLADAERGEAAVLAGEADMPEPISGFIKFARSQVVVVAEPFFERDLPVGRGKLKLLREGNRLFLNSAEGLGAADDRLRRRFIRGGKPEPDGYWVELAEPRAQLFNDLEPWDLRDVAPELFQRLAARTRRGRSALVGVWLGVTFMEEGPVRGEVRRNWAFGWVDSATTSAVWFQAQALTRSERSRRTPELVGLDRARVLVAGAGSLGAPVTFELAKAGAGHLDIVDPDIFDVNNAARHALPVTCAGQNKAEAVAEAALMINPFVEATHYPISIQGFGPDGNAVRQLIEDSTVVVDTTGSNTAARVLQRLCIEAERPLVVAGLTAGSYGGVVRVAEPNGPCFDCLLLHQQDGAIAPVSEAPPTSLVTPRGCSHPAFAGAGFEATQLAAVAARAVVQTSHLSSYPAASYNWAVLNFRTAPGWRSGIAQRHPDCWRHG
ncbi:MAG: ThiF family adenylyltransferase [Solirubrobacterales bacterium]|nr:ThiF family adenylyltransferase [Solirubrobacterales bacterium]